MPDGFQAEPPRWSAERPSAYERYSEVNLRKPDKRGSGVPWAFIAVATAFLSVGLIGAFMFAMIPSPPMAIGPPVTAAFVAVPPPPVVALGDKDAEVASLLGSWTALTAIVDGDQATDDELAKIKLTMDEVGFKLALPATMKQGPSWKIQTEFKPNARGNWDVATKKLQFLFDDGSTLPAIYEVDGDTMKMCFGPDAGPCPNDFTAKKDSKRTLLILKRQAP